MSQVPHKPLGEKIVLVVPFARALRSCTRAYGSVSFKTVRCHVFSECAPSIGARVFGAVIGSDVKLWEIMGGYVKLCEVVWSYAKLCEVMGSGSHGKLCEVM